MSKIIKLGILFLSTCVWFLLVPLVAKWYKDKTGIDANAFIIVGILGGGLYSIACCIHIATGNYKLEKSERIGRIG